MRASVLRAIVMFAVFTAAHAGLGLSPAAAQSPGLVSSSYITPFPETDRYQAHVIGDWLAGGLASGLEDAFKQDGTIQFISSTRGSSGLIRQYDWTAEAERMVKDGPVHVVIIMMGVNDARSIRVGKARYQPGTPEWREEYTKEAEKLIKAFRAANVAVYWVSLPAMSNSNLNNAIETMNDAVRQAAYLNGAKFIDTWSGFTDQTGGYSSFGADLTGQTKRLRNGDGVGFTAAGNRKLAYYVEIVLKRDLALARQQRTIPLAGDEEEQSRVVPKLARLEKPGDDNSGPDEGSPAPSEGQADAPAGDSGSGPAGNTPDNAGPEQPAGAEQSIAAVRPQPLPIRQDQAAFASAIAPSDIILGELDSGLTSIAVISPLNDVSFRDAQRRIPLSERLYFKVFSKGDALPPKEGRADDFVWQNQGQAQ